MRMNLGSVYVAFFTMLAVSSQGFGADLIYGKHGSFLVTFDVSLNNANDVLNSRNSIAVLPIGYSYADSTIAVDYQGNVYYSDFWGHTIDKWDAAGNLQNSIGNQSNVGNPIGVTVDHSGNVYASQSPGNISKFDGSGTYQGVWRGGAYVGLASDLAGNIYAVADGSNNVYKLNSSGNVQFTITTAIQNPKQIVVDPFGNIYVSNQGGGGYISKYDSSGGYLSSFGSLSGVGGLALDSSNNLYAAADNGINKFNSSGVFQFSWALANSTIIGSAPHAVPEPSTYALAAIGSGVVAVVARRRKRRGG